MSKALRDHWERTLEAEGLGLGDPWGPRASEVQLARCTEPFTGASGSDWDELQRMRVVVSWLPECDRLALRWMLEGLEQQEIGDRLGVARSTAALRIAEAIKRARMLDSGPLPANRDEYRRQLKGFLVGRHIVYHQQTVLSYFVDLLDVWSPTAARRRHGIPSSTTTRWTDAVLGTDGPRLAPVRHVLGVIRRARHMAKPVIVVEEGWGTLPRSCSWTGPS